MVKNLVVATALVLLLAGCAASTSAGQPGLRNGAGQPVDPTTGTPAPGAPSSTGGY